MTDVELNVSQSPEKCMTPSTKYMYKPHNTIFCSFCSIPSIPENMFAMPDTICVRACVWCMCLWYWLYIFGLMWVIIWRTFNPTTKTGKNSADTAIHSHTHSTHRERHTHTLTIFKWEMTNATETAQTAIKFIIYLNCQAFFVASFLCTI